MGGRAPRLLFLQGKPGQRDQKCERTDQGSNRLRSFKVRARTRQSDPILGHLHSEGSAKSAAAHKPAASHRCHQNGRQRLLVFRISDVIERIVHMSAIESFISNYVFHLPANAKAVNQLTLSDLIAVPTLDQLTAQS